MIFTRKRKHVDRPALVIPVRLENVTSACCVRIASSTMCWPSPRARQKSVSATTETGNDRHSLLMRPTYVVDVAHPGRTVGCVISFLRRGAFPVLYVDTVFKAMMPDPLRPLKLQLPPTCNLASVSVRMYWDDATTEHLNRRTGLVRWRNMLCRGRSGGRSLADGSCSMITLAKINTRIASITEPHRYYFPGTLLPASDDDDTTCFLYLYTHIMAQKRTGLM
nr:hypothetical protein CFP56_52506 [Quercus suber]